MDPSAAILVMIIIIIMHVVRLNYMQFTNTFLSFSLSLRQTFIFYGQIKSAVKRRRRLSER